MSVHPIRIAIKDSTSGKYYTALKIIPYGSGGFAVILPRHKSKSVGVLERYKIRYKSYGTKMKLSHEETQQYRADDIVKLSYHQDGFVQFSSATNSKILSGKNEDGSPKGLGVKSWSLDEPVSTGASIAMSLWGIANLDETGHTKIDDRYLFETDAAKSHYKHPIENANDVMYGMTIYIVKKPIEGYVFTVNGRRYATLAYMGTAKELEYFTRVREQVRLIDIPDQDVLLGIGWSCFGVKREGNFGYNFLGPSDGKHGLMATYPETAVKNAHILQSLMYNPSLEDKNTELSSKPN